MFNVLQRHQSNSHDLIRDIPTSTKIIIVNYNVSWKNGGIIISLKIPGISVVCYGD